MHTAPPTCRASSLEHEDSAQVDSARNVLRISLAPTFSIYTLFKLSKFLNDKAATIDCSRKLKMPYTVAQLLKMSSAQLDDIYKAAKPGPIPDGDAKGTAIIAPGTTYDANIAEFVNLFLWQGKVFDAKDKILVNKITAFGLRAIIAEIRVEPSWIDGKDCIVLDYSKTSLVVQWVRDEIRLIGPGLYLGQVCTELPIDCGEYQLTFAL